MNLHVQPEKQQQKRETVLEAAAEMSCTSQLGCSLVVFMVTECLSHLLDMAEVMCAVNGALV